MHPSGAACWASWTSSNPDPNPTPNPNPTPTTNFTPTPNPNQASWTSSNPNPNPIPNPNPTPTPTPNSNSNPNPGKLDELTAPFMDDPSAYGAKLDARISEAEIALQAAKLRREEICSTIHVEVHAPPP